jgi:selenocysteine-specific translation elongation factor
MGESIMNDSEAKSGTGKYKKSKKHKENLRKALKKYWSDTQRHDDWTEKIKEGIEDYWENKPDEDFVLGKRIRQKIDGIRDKEGYREYQRRISKEV